MGKKQKALVTVQAQAPAADVRRKLKNTVRRYEQHVLICTDGKSKQCKRGGPRCAKRLSRRSRRANWAAR